MDEEDEMECACHIVCGVGKDGDVFLDRVYRSEELCKRRVKYLSELSGDRAEWFYTYSELGR